MTDRHPRRTEFGGVMTVGAKRLGALQPEALDALVHDVREGLTSVPKSLPSRWLYEGAGSELFELITGLDEYYPTRAERSILGDHATEIVLISGASRVVELGSGTSEKTRLLLDAFYEVDRLEAFVAMDAAEQTLQGSVEDLAARYARTDVSGGTAAFNADLSGRPTGPPPW